MPGFDSRVWLLVNVIVTGPPTTGAQGSRQGIRRVGRGGRGCRLPALRGLLVVAKKRRTHSDGHPLSPNGGA